MTIADLVQDPHNRRTHPARNLEMVAASLAAVGAARSIVIDEGNVILAGNGVTSAAAAAGLTKLRIIDAQGDELIAVRRSGLTDDQKRALAIYDNRAGELAEWNAEQLREDAANGIDLTPYFFAEELVDLGLAVAGPPTEGEGAGVVVGQAAVIVLCADEAEQRRVYENLISQGLTCKVVNT